jgi:hypothetical protein
MQLCFSLGFAVTGALMVGFSPIANSISDVYGCSVFTVEVQALLFTVMYIPSNFTVIYIHNNYGLSKCLKMGAVLVIFGAWMR